MNVQELAIGGRRGHLAIPSDTDRHQAVIVIGENPSATSDLTATADMLAGLGYVALAFPPFDADVAPEPVRRSIMDAITALNRRNDVRRGDIAVWSFGVNSGMIAATIQGLAAGIIVHLDADAGPAGDWHGHAFDPNDVQCPLLLIFATSRPDADASIARIRNELGAVDKAVEVQRYDAPAAPNNGSLKAFPSYVIADLWERVRAFLQQHMQAQATIAQRLLG